MSLAVNHGLEDVELVCLSFLEGGEWYLGGMMNGVPKANIWSTILALLTDTLVR